MCRVEKCCGCCTLRTGATIVAVLSGIYVIGCLVLTIMSFVGQDAWEKEMHKQGHNPDDYKGALWTSRVFMIIGIVLYAVLTFCLYQAISKNKPGCMIPWLVIEIIGLVGTFIQAILAFTSQNVAGGAIMLVGIVIRIYIWICMYSYYQELKEGGGGGHV